MQVSSTIVGSIFALASSQCSGTHVLKPIVIAVFIAKNMLLLVETLLISQYCFTPYAPPELSSKLFGLKKLPAGFQGKSKEEAEEEQEAHRHRVDLRAQKTWRFDALWLCIWLGPWPQVGLTTMQKLRLGEPLTMFKVLRMPALFT